MVRSPRPDTGQERRNRDRTNGARRAAGENPSIPRLRVAPRPLGATLRTGNLYETPPGREGARLASRVRHYRNRRGWKQIDLCKVFARRFNVKLDTATLARLENGRRRVTIDEACMFAVALDVPLTALLWPVEETEPVSLAPGVEVSPWQAWEWTQGWQRLPEADRVAWTDALQPSTALNAVLIEATAASQARTYMGRQEGTDDYPTARAAYLEALTVLADGVADGDAQGLPARTVVADAGMRGLLERYRNVRCKAHAAAVAAN